MKYWMPSPHGHMSHLLRSKKNDHSMQKNEITQSYQLYSLLSASQWKGDNYNSAQEKGCALETAPNSELSKSLFDALPFFSMVY